MDSLCCVVADPIRRSHPPIPSVEFSCAARSKSHPSPASLAPLLRPLSGSLSPAGWVAVQLARAGSSTERSWLGKYIASLYFAYATMTTVRLMHPLVSAGCL